MIVAFKMLIWANMAFLTIAVLLSLLTDNYKKGKDVNHHYIFIIMCNFMFWGFFILIRAI